MRISPGGGNNTSSKGGNSMKPNSGRKKWVITIVIAAILIAAAVAVAILVGPGTDDPVVDVPKESPLGVYYYDTAEGEYLLTLTQGNVFMISGPSLNKSGKCIVNGDGIELDFVKDEDGTGSLKEENGVMVLQYKDKTMRFLEKKTFKVNFNVNGGSEVAAIDVVNGKTVAKPADPRRTAACSSAGTPTPIALSSMASATRLSPPTPPMEFS